jgi:carotenoid cleavage dioxygenase
LRGTLYRNGPARHELGGIRYRHWFDGDGMIHAFRFSDDGVSHSGRYVRTAKYAAETEAGRFLYASFGTPIDGARPISGADSINVANTSVLPFAGELLALWEGGSAYQLDPRTLATVGPKVWRRDLRGMPFSAHPRLEPDGTLWNFGVVNGRGLVIYHLSASGQLVKADLIAVSDVPMVHDFALTARSLVFLLPPLVLDREKAAAGATFLDAHVWNPQAPLRVLVIDKSDWSKRRWYELPTGFVFHLGNAWEDQAGVIRLDYMRAGDPSGMFRSSREVMRGERAASEGTHPTLAALDPASGSARQESRGERAEFPRVDARVIGRRYAQLYTLYSAERPARFGFQGVQRLDLETHRVDRFDYGAGFFPEEHIHVADPAAAAEGSGWLLGTAIDLQRQVSVLSVFDALNLSAGPIAQASLPYALPAGLHGNFSPAIH